PLAIPPGLMGRPGKPETGHRRYHQVECERGIGSCCSRVGQRSDDVGVLQHSPWPAMTENERNGVRLSGADVQEMHPLSVDGRDELREGVELGFGRTPVIARLPVLSKLTDVTAWYSVVPRHFRHDADPSGAGQPLMQIVEIVLRDVNEERLDLVARARHE